MARPSSTGISLTPLTLFSRPLYVSSLLLYIVLTQRHGRALAENLKRQGIKVSVHSVRDAGHTVSPVCIEEFPRCLVFHGRCVYIPCREIEPNIRRECSLPMLLPMMLMTSGTLFQLHVDNPDGFIDALLDSWFSLSGGDSAQATAGSVTLGPS